MGFDDKEGSSSSSRLHTTPLLPHHGGAVARLSSQPKTFANVFIAVVGSGVLGLPYTFSRTGWAAGSILLLAVAALTYHCMMLLVASRRRLADEHPKIASFGDLGAAVYGAAGRHTVDAMLVLSQASFCIGYLLFIANTLAHLYPIGGSSSASSPLLTAKALFIWAMLPFQLGLNSIKTLTLLAPLSIFADVVDLGAMGVVLGQDTATWLAEKPPVFAFGGPAEVLYGLGVAVYAFEGIGMVLPLEAEAADKRKFGGTLGLSMAFIAIMYGLFGAMGYLAFGASTRDIITTNLGAGWLSVTVQLGLCINLFFTMPVMMNPVYEVAERLLHGKRYAWWLRWILVVFVGLMAMLVPNFADFLSLVGSSVCVLLGFVLPAAFHLKVMGADIGWPGLVSDVAIIGVGLALSLSGTWTSLAQMISGSPNA
ncbi:amino acid transporter AVT3B-like [Lolium rigidum]|uniref:amino acid transporter AVT3B-like n=1 Tax=Lolium rigidum TaxID=89674 RepID=UPI001F5D019F|nr:amino acid transporter AVT3B-like [Lolium rigidum]